MSDTKSSSGNETGHVVSRHSLEALANRIADLEAQLAEARIQLRIAANYRHTTEGEHDDGDFSICRHPACEYAQAAIDGGALGEG